MPQERKAQLLDNLLEWASEMWDGYELYEWARNRGMTHEEICEEFCFDDKEADKFWFHYADSYSLRIQTDADGL